MKSVGAEASKANLDDEGGLLDEDGGDVDDDPASCARRIAVEIGEAERRSQGSSAYLEVTMRSIFEEEGAAGGSETLAASSGVDEMIPAFRETTSGRSSSTYREGARPAACSLKNRVSDPAPKLTI